MRRYARVGGLSAAQSRGLETWHRDNITVLVPYDSGVDHPIGVVGLVRPRRPLGSLRSAADGVPVARSVPATLLWAASETIDPRLAGGSGRQAPAKCHGVSSEVSR